MPGASITWRNTVVVKYWFKPILSAYSPSLESNMTSSVGLFGLVNSLSQEVTSSMKRARVATNPSFAPYFISVFPIKLIQSKSSSKSNCDSSRNGD